MKLADHLFRQNNYRMTDEIRTEFETAQFHFERSLSCTAEPQPVSGETVLHLAQCLGRLGDDEAAEREFDRAVRIANAYHGRKSFIHLTYARYWSYKRPPTDRSLAGWRTQLQLARQALVSRDAEYAKTKEQIDELEQKLKTVRKPNGKATNSNRNKNW